MKNHLPLIALVLLANTTLCSQALSQTVYKCGNVYSHHPCPGAVTIDASDKRTAAQKAQTDAAAAQSARSADKMEKDRLALEKVHNAKESRKALYSASDASRIVAKNAAKQKKKTPEYFTASVAAEKKKAKNAGKKSGRNAQTLDPDKASKP